MSQDDINTGTMTEKLDALNKLYTEFLKTHFFNNAIPISYFAVMFEYMSKRIPNFAAKPVSKTTLMRLEILQQSFYDYFQDSEFEWQTWIDGDCRVLSMLLVRMLRNNKFDAQVIFSQTPKEDHFAVLVTIHQDKYLLDPTLLYTKAIDIQLAQNGPHEHTESAYTCLFETTNPEVIWSTRINAPKVLDIKSSKLDDHVAELKNTSISNSAYFPQKTVDCTKIIGELKEKYRQLDFNTLSKTQLKTLDQKQKSINIHTKMDEYKDNVNIGNAVRMMNWIANNFPACKLKYRTIAENAN